MSESYIRPEMMMASEISARFEIKGWDEQPFDEAVGVAKLTKASVAREYTGRSRAPLPPSG
jgi:hypothetical protein